MNYLSETKEKQEKRERKGKENEKQIKEGRKTKGNKRKTLETMREARKHVAGRVRVPRGTKPSIGVRKEREMDGNTVDASAVGELKLGSRYSRNSHVRA